MRLLFLTSLLFVVANTLPELAITKRGKYRNRSTTSGPLRLARRHETLGIDVFDDVNWSTGGAYYANVTVGTPPQNQIVILDTGSSDLYFDASTAATCQGNGPFSCQGGTFNSKQSSTFSVAAASPAFNTSFGDGSSAVGPFGQDVIGIGDVTLSNVQFGVADEIKTTTGFSLGLMGLGYSANEATWHFYPNMPEVLRDTGVINSRLYSVYLNDESAASGSILFGGIDKSKFTGDLVTLNLLPSQVSGKVDQFISVVTAVNATVNGKASTLISGGSSDSTAYSANSGALPVLLDTGSTAWSVSEDDWIQYFAPVFTYVDEQGLCSCTHMDTDDTLSLEFGGAVTIHIPAREFIAPYINSTTHEAVRYDNDNDACLFLITPSAPTGQGFQTLGDAILRSMYVVFDLDNGQVSIAQAAANSTAAPDIVTVQDGPNGVAAAVGSGVVASSGSNSFSIAPAVTSGTGSLSASSVQTMLGLATTTAAISSYAQTSRPTSASTIAGEATLTGSEIKPTAVPNKSAAVELEVPFVYRCRSWIGGMLIAMVIASSVGFMIL